MLRLFLTKHFSFQAYRPLRPLLADKTLIYETDPAPKPNILLYQLPGLLLAANNFLTEWTWMSSGAFTLAVIAGNAFFFQRLVKWTSGITEIWASRQFNKVFFKFSSGSRFKAVNLPQSEFFRFNEESGELEVERRALSENELQKSWPREIAEVQPDKTYYLDLLHVNEEQQTAVTGLVLGVCVGKSKAKGYEEYVRALIAMKDVDSGDST